MNYEILFIKNQYLNRSFDTLDSINYSTINNWETVITKDYIYDNEDYSNNDSLILIANNIYESEKYCVYNRENKCSRAIDDYDLIKIDLFGYVNYFLIKDGKPINVPYKYTI